MKSEGAGAGASAVPGGLAGSFKFCMVFATSLPGIPSAKKANRGINAKKALLATVQSDGNREQPKGWTPNGAVRHSFGCAKSDACKLETCDWLARLTRSVLRTFAGANPFLTKVSRLEVRATADWKVCATSDFEVSRSVLHREQPKGWTPNGAVSPMDSTLSGLSRLVYASPQGSSSLATLGLNDAIPLGLKSPAF